MTAGELLESGCSGKMAFPGRQALRLNEALDRAVAADGLFNENHIENLLKQLQADLLPESPCFWLLMARLTELTLILAGRYADACEYAAAGDLIVNPRQIKVHFFREKPYVLVKNRRESLSAQFNTAGRERQDFIRWFRQTAVVEVVQAPLLDFFMETLQMSRILGAVYLEAVRQRMTQVADTLGFLGSWHIKDAADFQCRLRSATPETQWFVRSHLCSFDLSFFTAIGSDIEALAAGKRCSGDFLIPSCVASRSGVLEKKPDGKSRRMVGAGYRK